MIPTKAITLFIFIYVLLRFHYLCKHLLIIWLLHKFTAPITLSHSHCPIVSSLLSNWLTAMYHTPSIIPIPIDPPLTGTLIWLYTSFTPLTGILRGTSGLGGNMESIGHQVRWSASHQHFGGGTLGKEWKMSRRDDKVKEVTKYVALHLNLSHSLQLGLTLRKQWHTGFPYHQIGFSPPDHLHDPIFQTPTH